MERIYLDSIGCGSIRVAKKFINKENLANLFQIDQPIVVEKETAEEITDYTQLRNDVIYLVASEKDLDALDDDDSGELPQEIIRSEQERMDRVKRMQEARKQFVTSQYKPKHPEIFKFSEKDVLLPEFVHAIETKSEGEIGKMFKREGDTPIWSFAMFTEKFCKDLMEEVDCFEASGLPVMRPNTMNNYGIILEEMGFDGFFTQLLEYVKPFATLLFGPIGSQLDSHHSFIVEYKIGEDEELDFHYDDSEVTINFCLGKDFTGGDLYFKGLLNDPTTHNEDLKFSHQRGLGLVHLGVHRHGATKIKSGERYNLIIWFRSQKLRDESRASCQCGGEHEHHHHHQH